MCMVVIEAVLRCYFLLSVAGSTHQHSSQVVSLGMRLDCYSTQAMCSFELVLCGGEVGTCIILCLQFG